MSRLSIRDRIREIQDDDIDQVLQRYPIKIPTYPHTKTFNVFMEDAEEAAKLKADQAGEDEALADKHEKEKTALKLRHERENERQGVADKSEKEAEASRKSRQTTEAFSKKQAKGKDIAKKMMKSKTMKAFAKKVAKMSKVSPSELDKILPDYVSGGDIGALFEGKKRFHQTDGIGKSKYTVSYHDGKNKHKDGSDFFDIEIFKNKPSLEKFKKDLKRKGYTERPFATEDVKESFSRSLVNKAIKLVKSPKYFQGDYTGAVKAIEKLKRGLSGDARVKAALQTANEHHKKKGMHTHSEGVDGDAMIDLMQKYLNTKNKGEKKNLLKQINRYQKKLGLKVTEELGANATVGDYISDFSKSDAPQFKGKSAKKVTAMAIAAFNANK